MFKEPLEYLPRSLNDQYEAFIKIYDIKQLFKKADYELMYYTMGWQKIEKLLANDYEFLADLFEAAAILEMPEQLFGTTLISNLISEYVDASLGSFPHLTDHLARKYLKLVEFASNKEEFVQNLFKLGAGLGKTKFEDFISLVRSVLVVSLSPQNPQDKIVAKLANNLFFSTMVKYIMEQKGTHLFQKFHSDEKLISIYDYIPKYISIDTVKYFDAFLQTNSVVISNNSTTLSKLLAITKQLPFDKLLLSTAIKQIMQQGTYIVMHEIQPEYLKKFNLEKPLSTKLVTEQNTNPIIKAILEKIHVQATLSKEEEITFTKNFIAGLEAIIKNPDIFAILRVAASEDFAIEIYKGTLDDPYTSGFYSSKSKVIALGNLEKLISGQSSEVIIKFISTLAHESIHLILDKLYVNKSEPFAVQDKASKEAFTAIKNGIIKLYKELSADAMSDSDYTLYDGYEPEKYNLEIPAFFTTQLTRCILGEELPQNSILARNPGLQKYMQKIFKTASLDSGIKATLIEYLSAESDIIQIAMDYARGYHHEEERVVEIIGNNA